MTRSHTAVPKLIKKSQRFCPHRAEAPREPPDQNHVWVVQSKAIHRRAATGSNTVDDTRIFVRPLEMLRPNRGSRIEKGNTLVGFRIYAMGVLPLSGVAMRTGQSKIGELGSASIDSRIYMVDWKPPYLASCGQ